jgi:imidazolonepropionase-like amidohydrolase
VRTLLTIREPGADPFPLLIEGATFAEHGEAQPDEVLDTRHLYAIGGLADCHAHLGMTNLSEAAGLSDDEIRSNGKRHAWMQLAGGVLLALDKGSSSDVSLEFLDIEPSRRPALQMAGRIIAAAGGYYPGYAYEVDEAGLADAVRTALAGPASWVKIIGDWPRRGEGPRANYTEDALRKAVEIAHSAGGRVAVHTMAPQVASMVARTEVDSVEHGTFLNEDDLRALGDRGAAWVPTLTGTRSVVDFLGEDSSGGRLLTAGLANLRDLLPVAERMGVTVLAGTDLAVPHGSVAVETLALIEHGLSPHAALAGSTTAAYDHAGVERGFAPGYPADVVFTRADPLEEPETLLTPEIVIREGRIVRGPE